MMQANQFYTSQTNNFSTLVFMSLEECKSSLINLSESEQACLSTHNFLGKIGDVVAVYNSKGCLTKAFIGSGDGNITLAIAYAATRLPKGTYASEKPLSSLAILKWALAQYRFDAYKKNPISPRLLLLTPNQLEAILPEAEAVFLVRDLINQPTNALGPAQLAEVVKNLAATHQAEFKQWVGDELLTANFPAIHAVGRAAKNVPRLLTLSWGDEKHPRVAIVGKGVCFDSGGLDLKPSSGMRIMKKDMGGAAQAIGLAQWIMVQKLPIRLVVYIPALENAVGSNAYRPGDILTMRNGLTVEIDNTDAEGRLVLADAITLACEQNPELLIDFATLTGAARTAVGTEIAAMFTNNDTVADELTQSSIKTEDPIWRLPLFGNYMGMLDSSIADMVNSSASPYAGAITAALFIQRFITSSLPWVHFDIMAWNVGNKPGKPEGGEAMAMRAVADYLKQRYQI